MRWRTIFALLKKEFLNSRRDKRSFWMTLLVPGLILPAAMIVMPIVGALAGAGAAGTNPLKPELKVAYQGEMPDALKAQFTGSISSRLITLSKVDSAQAAVKTHTIALELPAQIPTSIRAKPAQIKVHIDSEKRISELARVAVERAVDAYNNELWKAELKANGMNTRAPELLSLSQPASESAIKVKLLSVLGIFLPLMFVLWGMTGAQTSAVEALAYERDHGTFETLLASQVTRAEVLLGKYFNVFGMAALATLSGLLGLLLVYYLGLYSVQKFFDSFAAFVVPLITQFFPQSFEPAGILYGALAALSTLSIIAAVALFPNVFAPSIKEAQLYIAPAMLTTMALAAPALAAEFLGLGKLLNFIPISNSVGILSGSFSQAPDWPRLALVLIINSLVAGAILFANWLLMRRERVIFKSS